MSRRTVLLMMLILAIFVAVVACVALRPPAAAPVSPPIVPGHAGARPSATTASVAPAISVTTAAPAPSPGATDPYFVPADANPIVASVVEASKTGTHPERLTPAIQPKAFDAAAWAKDAQYPQRYLDTFEPGRVFQPAQPGNDVPVLERVGDEVRSIPVGGQVELQVRCRPSAPCTFNSFDSGRFEESKLSGVTVRANDEGIASATFAWTPGTVGQCRILAASPLSSGQARFTVTIIEKTTP